MSTAGVREEWGRRVHAETNSAGVTAQLFALLVQLEAPRPLLLKCEAIIQDELRHAAGSQEVFTLAGGTARQLAKFAIPAGPAASASWSPLHQALSITISSFCCGETVAVPLFLAMFQGAHVPAAKRVLKGILKDEGRHRAFGWAVLPVLLKRASKSDRAVASKLAQQGVRDVVDAYSHATWEPSEAEQTWGVIGPEAYRRASQQALKKVLEPRFAALDLLSR